MKVLHVLSSNKYSGAENVACQIISMFADNSEFEFAYSSPDGEIKNSLQEKQINFFPMKKMCKSEVKRVIKEFKPDVIHAHDIKAICFSLMATNKIKVVGHIHRNHPDFNKKSFRSLVFKHFAKRKNLTKLFWVSDSCYNDYIYNKDVKAKSAILGNIINIETIKKLAKNSELQEKSDLVYFGRLTDVKNPLRLLEIVSILKTEFPYIMLAIVGDGDLAKEMKLAVKEKNLENNVKFYGYQSNGYGILSNSKILLLTSKTEGIPMCILEAQVFGLPVISTKINGLERVVVNNETGFMYNSNEEAANIIANVLKDKKLYNKLNKKTIQFAVDYNLPQEFIKMLKEAYTHE